MCPGVAARGADPAPQTEPSATESESDVIYANGEPVVVPTGVFERGDGPRVLARFAGPIRPAWVAALTDCGAVVAFWCPPFGACLTVGRGLRLQELPFIRGTVAYDEQHCTRPDLGVAVAGAGAGAVAAATRPEARLVDVVCFDQAARRRVAKQLAQLGIQVIDQSSTKIRIVAPADIIAVRNLVGVKVVDPARPHVLTSVLDADQLAGAIGAAEQGRWPAGLDGRGEIVAVTDTGLDTGIVGDTLCHDFAGRVASVRSWPLNPSWSAFVRNPGADDGAADTDSGHGTYVTGLVLGDGGGSGGRHRGVAPGARLVFHAIEQWADVDAGRLPGARPGYYLAGRPLDLRELLRASAAAGATIHVNAWGDQARGAYTNDSYEVDLFLREHPEAVVLFASGNGGSDNDGDRVVDAASCDAPATAKNVIAVGATEGPVYGVGYLGTWTGLQHAGQLFANVADRRDGVSGDVDRIALISGRGPTTDGRVRPDVCAPGTNLAGPRSSVAQGTGWGYADPAPGYMYSGGTSTAVAVAGGAMALLRQAWRQARRGRAPRGATMKAIVLAGAVPVLARDGQRAESRDVAGFGRIAISASLPQGHGGRGRILSDASYRLVTGGRQRWRLHLSTAGPVRVVLTWYDVANERLVNDLDLSVVTPAGVRWWGNHGRGDPGRADRTNSVEVVDLEAVAGTYVVEVTGFNVPDGPQPYALVASVPPGTTTKRGG